MGEFNTFIGAATAAPLAAGSVTLGVVTGNEATVVNNLAKVATNGVTSITLASDAVFTSAVTNNAAALTDGGVSLTNKAVRACCGHHGGCE